MSSTIPALPAVVHDPVKTYPKPTASVTADAAPRPSEHRSATALSASDIGYVDSLMGIAPAQEMEYIMLRTGVPVPANLGQDIDTSV